MEASFILDAIRRKYPSAAVVPEVSIEDIDLPDTGEPTECMFMPSENRPDGHKYMRRIDALMFDSLVRTAIEIKVTRDDFMRDTYWKRRAWQKVTHRFVYAVPLDLDVAAPHGCGLWKIDDTGRITIAKKAIVSRTPDALPQSVVQRLAYRAATQDHGADGQRAPRGKPDRAEVDLLRQQNNVLQGWVSLAQERAENAESEANQLRAQIKAMRAEHKRETGGT